MASNKVSFEDDQLLVEPVGIDKVLGFENCLKIPLHHVVDASLDNGEDNQFVWRKLGYGGINKKVGTFSSKGQDYFYNFDRSKAAIVISLQNEKFSRLVLDVDEPNQVITDINAKVAELTQQTKANN